MSLTGIHPAGMPRPSGYSYGMRAQGGTTLYVAGQLAWDADRRMVGVGDIVRQFEQTLVNFQAVVTAGGATLRDVAKLNLYVLDKQDYFAKAKAIGAVYRRFFGDHYPAMTLVEVRDLAEKDQLIEVEGVAVVGAG
ncbi:MAG TPA: RidA family protein [Candidatus Methylomirabilis sp.]|jgi:enamine deaminase RidA (YjgF/YER057c/UK114 family)